jgi:hypothetical protein
MSYMSNMSQSSPIIVMCAVFAGCAAVIAPADIRAIEVRDEDAIVRLQGPELAAFLRGVECHDGTVLWKGGLPATVVLADGRRRAIDGFSFYGHFYRVSRRQWCVVDPEQFRRVFDH